MHVHNDIKTLYTAANKTNNNKHLMTAICQLHMHCVHYKRSKI